MLKKLPLAAFCCTCKRAGKTFNGIRGNRPFCMRSIDRLYTMVYR